MQTSQSNKNADVHFTNLTTPSFKSLDTRKMRVDDQKMLNPTILDQPSKIKEIDSSHMLETCERTPYFCDDAFTQARKIEIPEKVQISNRLTINYKTPRNILIVGMGGSAIGGEILRDWLTSRVSIPINVSQDYLLPAYANEDSLVIAVSYSGETEETLSTFIEALKRGCMIVTISSGGHLRSFSQKLKLPHIPIPGNLPAPRAAIAYTFFPLVALMEKFQIIKNTEEEFVETLRILRQISEENSLQTPLEDNKAKTTASEIGDTTPIVYGFRQYKAVARRLKCQFNENSKVPSKFDVFSELNHNEIVGWEAPKNLTKNLSVILIRDPEEPSELNRRIEITKQIVTAKAHKVMEIQAKGKKPLAKIFSTLLVGDFTSIYLALLRGVDPTPTKTISHLKEEMKKRFDMTMKFEEEIKKLT